MARYLILMAAFYLLSDRVLIDDQYDSIIMTVSDGALYLLIFTMGLRLGANDEVVSKLGEVGLQGLLTVFMAFLGSVGMAWLFKKIFRMDPGKGRKGDRSDLEQPKEERGAEFTATAVIFSIVVTGLMAGHFIVSGRIENMDAFQDTAGNLIDIFLCILLASVGYGLGREGHILDKFRAIGLKALVLPAAIMSGTAIMGLVYGLIGPLGLRESLAVFMGMGWYGLAPALIMKAGYVTASAVSFLHNIFREVFSMLLIPAVATHLGFFEAASLPGSTGMDCCLPTIRKCTNNNTVIISLVSGIICSFSVPLLVPVILG